MVRISNGRDAYEELIMKLADLKLTCSTYPDSRFQITRIESELNDGQKKYIVYATQECEQRKMAAIDYIPLETSVTLHGLINEQATTGFIMRTNYEACRMPELVATFCL